MQYYNALYTYKDKNNNYYLSHVNTLSQLPRHTLRSSHTICLLITREHNLPVDNAAAVHPARLFAPEHVYICIRTIRWSMRTASNAFCYTVGKEKNNYVTRRYSEYYCRPLRLSRTLDAILMTWEILSNALSMLRNI
jgi:hypothetical protein